jgi:hypothetical protein
MSLRSTARPYGRLIQQNIGQPATWPFDEAAPELELAAPSA